MKPITTRFAPSPSGFLHLGNVRTALFSLLAALPEGQFLIRIEDTDAERVRPAYRDAALADLEALGFGPYIDPARIVYQSERGDIYAAHLATLAASGAVYPCFCTTDMLAAERQAAAHAGRPPRYSGRCAALDPLVANQRLAAGEPAVWRFRVPGGRVVRFIDAVRGEQTLATDLLGDFVVRRANGEPMFFFTNALDDALTGVTLVLRGEDHLSNTSRQVLLLEALQMPVPVYGHLPLVLNAGGTPLSKREGAASVQDLRAEGFLPIAIVNYLARLGATLGSDALLNIPELARHFAVERISHAPARYDRQQLIHWQKLAMAKASTANLAAHVLSLVPDQDCARFVEMLRPNVVFPQELTAWAEIFYGADPVLEGEARAAVEAVGPAFFAQAQALMAVGEIDGLPQRLKSTGVVGKRLFHALRAALTGTIVGPELKDILTLMPRETITRRLQRLRGEGRAENL